jgi:hypothetical protein
MARQARAPREPAEGESVSELTDEQMTELMGVMEFSGGDALRSAYAIGREEGLNALESWKIRHQDEVNARVEAENDLYAMQQERRREHLLRVKFAGAVESYQKLLVCVRETLYCTKMAPHEYDADHHCSHCGRSSAYAKDMIDNALMAAIEIERTQEKGDE